jgi:malate/lactate dehydrogenase
LINRQGANKVQEIILSKNELEGLQSSASNLKGILDGVEL